MNDYATRIAPDAMRLERLLPGPIERVWAFLTESDKRARWLAAGDMELRAGGKVELQLRSRQDLSRTHTREVPRHADGLHRQGDALRAAKLLEFTWMESHGSHSEVTWELAERGDRCC